MDFARKKFVKICQLLTFKIEKRCQMPAITMPFVCLFVFLQVCFIDFYFLVPHFTDFTGDTSRIWYLTCCARSVTVVIH